MNNKYPFAAPTGARPAAAAPTCAFTIHSRIRIQGSQAEQFQHTTPEFVVTEIGNTTLLFVAKLQSRFLVDRSKRELRLVDPDAQRQKVQQIRELVGSLTIARDDQLTTVDGHPCHTIRVSNRNAQLVLSIETNCTPIDGLEWTALAKERAYDAEHQPFSIPLGDNEIVVRSTTRALAASFGQSQTVQLVDWTPSVPDLARYEAMVRYRVIE